VGRPAGAAGPRIASVCTGAFILAEAGLLAGRRVTTHWFAAAALAKRHPEVEVDPEPIFVRDGDLWTSAGVTAGIDLALALVEADHGRETALVVARHLVMFLRRPGSPDPVLRPAGRAGRAAGPAARPAAVDRRAPRRRPVGPGARPAGQPVAAPVRADLRGRGRHDPRTVRRPDPPRDRAAPAGRHRRRGGPGRPGVRLRHGRGHASGVHRELGVPPADYRKRF
jgi:hypothetical protein